MAELFRMWGPPIYPINKHIKDTFIIIAAILRGFETFKVVVLRQLAYFFGQQSDTPEVISIKLRHKILYLWRFRMSICINRRTLISQTQNKIWTTKWHTFLGGHGQFPVFSAQTHDECLKLKQRDAIYLVPRFVGRNSQKNSVWTPLWHSQLKKALAFVSLLLFYWKVYNLTSRIDRLYIQ